MGKLPARKNIRLRGYDYSQNGAYYVTICVKDGHEILWEQKHVGAATCRPSLSHIGKIVDVAIQNIHQIYTCVIVDKYVIMPNHIHMILLMQNDNLESCVEECGRQIAAPTTISMIVRNMKRFASMQIGYSIWQRSYHDRIIRNEEEYQRIWKYIDENPLKREDDEYFVKEPTL